MASTLRLSEQSAILAATAPSLAVLNNEKELDETFLLLQGVLNSIKTDLDELPRESDLGSIEQVAEKAGLDNTHYRICLDNTKQLGEDSGRMEKELFNLKGLATKRLLFSERRTVALTKIQAIQQNLTEILNPVEYGVTSLTSLFGRRSARRIQNHYKQLDEDKGFLAK